MNLKSLLFAFLCAGIVTFTASVRHINENCLDFAADILISSDYKDDHGATKTSSYNVPTSYNDNSTCKDLFRSKKNAILELPFNHEDILILEFQSPAISGKSISLISVKYAYKQDRLRFPGILKESLQTASRTFVEDEFPIGIWNKIYKCANVVISLGNVTIELTNLQLVVFSTEGSKEGDSIKIVVSIDAQMPFIHLVTKCPESKALAIVKTSAVTKAVVFNDSCISGSMVIVIIGNYLDTKEMTKSFEFVVPENAKVETVCVDKFLGEKRASLKISYLSDSLEMILTAPPVYGDEVSLTAINFTILLDKAKFPEIGHPKIKQVMREFSASSFVLGEWGTRNKCPSTQLNLGSGLKVELRNVNFALSTADRATKEKECPASKTETRS